MSVDGSLAAKVRNRLDGNLRLRNRQGAWEGSGKRAVRGGVWGGGAAPPRIKIFLSQYSTVVLTVVIRVMIAKYRKSGIWGYRSSLTPEPIELK